MTTKPRLRGWETVAERARRVRIPEHAVRELIRKGELPAVKVGTVWVLPIEKRSAAEKGADREGD